MTDSGVMAWLLTLSPQKIEQAAPANLTEYGHLLETFAVGEVLKQVSRSDAPWQSATSALRRAMRWTLCLSATTVR